MSYLVNDPSSFAEEAARGFVLAHSRVIRAVPGGVVRKNADGGLRPAVVIGGGSGHYPLFAGFVGDGLADGAAIGGVFASPSTDHIVSVARSAERGRGVLLTYGNYAGDVLNFNAAQELLRAEGIPCETARVTDDIASAPRGEESSRRGIAGDLIVLKVGGAAARLGLALVDVARLAQLCNMRTRSFAISFSGCTLPGSSSPLFQVPVGSAATGMGLHGEPGLKSIGIPSARETAELLVRALLDETPSKPSNRVALVLNGLGAVKYEELFVVYNDVVRLLTAAGLTVVDPEVGEFCTSFDMAGLSLTLTWLTEELEGLWREGCTSPGFNKTSTVGLADVVEASVDEVSPIQVPAGFDASVRSNAQAIVFARALTSVAEMLRLRQEELGRLDAVAGDGDHGLGMSRGAKAAADAATEAAGQGSGVQSALKLSGDAWARKAGGASGALWGGSLNAISQAFDNMDGVGGAQVADGLQRAVKFIATSGGAKPGDKTMLDAMLPAADEFVRSWEALGPLAAADRAVAAALEGAEATKLMQPKLGRARTHADASLGHVDPGAMSLGLVAETFVESILLDRR